MHNRNHVLLFAIAAAIGVGIVAETAFAGKTGFIWGVARALSSVGRNVGLTVAVTGVDEPQTTLAVDIQPVEFPYDVTVHPPLGKDGATYFVSKDGKLTASCGETTVVLEPQPAGGFLAAVWVSGELVAEPIPLP
jgi:hypothetical protein